MRQKLRVLEVIASSGGGGAEHLFWLIKRADKSRFNFTVLMSEDAENVKALDLRALGVEVALSDVFNTFSLREFFKLRDFMEKGNFDIIHFHGTRAAMLGRMAVALVRHRPKIIYTIHGFHLIHYHSPFKRIFLLLVEKFLNFLTDAIICVSYSDKESITGLRLANDGKIRVIWNGVDIERFQKAKVDRDAKKKELNLPSDAIVLTMIGRLHPPKDHRTLLTAFQKAISKFQNAYLLIIGEGPLRAKIERYAQSLGLGEKVKFTGFRRDISEIMAMTDIFILSTLWEGLPFVLLEAMASSKPVIATDVNGNREIIVNEDTGLLVPPKDPEALAQAIIKLAGNPQRAKEMGEKGFLRVKEHFNLEAMVKKTTDLYESLSAKRMKILQVNKLYWPWIGGVEKVVQDIAEGLQGKVDVEVLACESKGRGKSRLVNGVDVTYASSLGIYWGMPVSLTFPFLLAWKSRKVDVLHFHLPFPLGVLSYLLMGPRRKKVVVTYHSDIIRQKKFMWFYEPLLKKFLDRVDKILVTSPVLIQSSKYLRPFESKCSVVPPSIDIDTFRYIKQNKVDLRIAPGEKVVLFVGRLSYYKGVEYLIEAMRKVDAKLLVVGDGELREELEYKTKSLGLDEKVMFLGEVSEDTKKYCYQVCDVFVLPSIAPSEAFGIVQLEAMAYGKPVVNTSLPTGVPFVSKDGETGFTVPPKDSDALAEAINVILADQELAIKFSKNALYRVREEFSKSKMLKTIYSVYQSLM